MKCTWIAFFFAAFLAVSACSTELVADLEQERAAHIVASLEAEGLSAEKDASPGKKGRYRVLVASRDKSQAFQLLNTQKLLRATPAGYEKLFAEGGLVRSPYEESARLYAAVGGELARSLRSVEGVFDARVHLSVPSAKLQIGPEELAKLSASVLVQHNPKTDLDDARIKTFVAGAVEGLEPEDVSVVRLIRNASKSTPQRLVALGPLRVARSSEWPLKALVASSLAVNLLLVAALIWTRRRARA